MNSTSAITEEVRVLMARRRINQTVLANAIGVSQGTMSRRLAGSQPFTVDELDAIADYFDVPVTDLFGFRTGSFPTNDSQQELPFMTPSVALAT